MRELDIPPSSYLFGAIVLLMVPMRWLLGWVLAVAVHECCHIWMIRALRGKITHIRIGLAGASIEIAPMSPEKELLCTMAGPAGGLLLLLTARWLPVVALCGLLQSLWNLLPIYPMDGGRILRCLLCLLLGEVWGIRVSHVLSLLVTTFLCGGAMVGTFCWNGGLFPLLAAGMLALGQLREKFLAKDGVWGYNKHSYVQKRYCDE